MKALVWFRSDLRIEDNPALKEAFKNSDIVEAIFLYSQNQHISHNEANVKIEFLIKNLFSLEERLSTLNVPLTIIESNGFEEDPTLIKKFCMERSINKVFWNNQFGEDETIRDKRVSKALASKNVDATPECDLIPTPTTDTLAILVLLPSLPPTPSAKCSFNAFSARNASSEGTVKVRFALPLRATF